MYYEWIQKNRRAVVAGMAIVVVLCTVWAAVTYVSRIGKIGVTVSAVPYDSTVTINGQRSGAGTVWLVPGTYTITAAKDGFVGRQKKVDVTTDKSQNVVSLALSPQSDDAKQWADAHQADYSNNEVYGGIEAQANGELFAKQHPIINSLPYNDPYFQIDYVQNPDNSITLTVTTPSPRYRYFAVQKIRQLGYDPTDYRIDFKDFNNPLGNKS
jgi:hypothetical protein